MLGGVKVLDNKLCYDGGVGIDFVLQLAIMAASAANWRSIE